MQLVESIAALQGALRDSARPLGLVPTMGTLHEGHLALVQYCRQENVATAVSIFVNPTQFGSSEDLESYPRDLKRDLQLLREEGVDLVFTPPAAEVYPPGFDTWVEPGELGRRLEGEFRPGHLRGVCTVVLKLFNLFRPDHAYFGQKDAQQALVVRRLAQDLATGVEVVTVPTVREPDGLAMSSRNAHLKPQERQAALVLHHALELARQRFQDEERYPEAIRSEIAAIIAAEPLARAEYVSIADAETLEELDLLERPALVSLAVHIGKTRLIDNILLP